MPTLTEMGSSDSLITASGTSAMSMPTDFSKPNFRRNAMQFCPATMKSLYALNVAVALTLGSASTFARPIMVRIEPSNTTVNYGDVFTIDIVADIPVDSAIVGWGID